MAAEITIKPKTELIPRLTGVLWGPPKAGKTTLLMSSPGKKLIVNVDPDGWNSVASRDDFSVIDLAQEDFQDVITFGKDKLGTAIAESDYGPGDTLIFDSISSYGQNALQMAVYRGIGKSNKWSPTMEEPGLSAYGARTQYIVQTVRNILKATAKKGMHCWFTSHEDTPTTNAAGEFLYQTMFLSDNGINQIGLSLSEIWYTFDANSVRKLLIRPARGKQPMGSRLFRMDKEPEFVLKYDPREDNSQPHSIETWYNNWIEGGKKPLELPK